ncbi:MAG: divalent-cation tolerance protein CutA [Planctomycetota bacterium]
MTDLYIVTVACGSEHEAKKIGGTVVAERLAACASCLADVQSIFWWEGEIQEEEETILMLKSHRCRFDELSDRIRELHSYEVPEIVSVPVAEALDAYLDWVKRETKADG